MPILIILFIGGLLLYAVIPVTIDFVNLQYTGKSTLLQMWGHFILSKIPSLRFGLRHFIQAFGHGNLLPGIQSRKFDSAVGIWLQTFTSLRILSREDSLHQESMLNSWIP